ncbi:hypothetical protein SXCC_01124 [Gluconacetobacter sp. SXCC-1]|nr:hypothetical protein SXCC_01124 [Gluconacetobacter sp. SXCC-1]
MRAAQFPPQGDAQCDKRGDGGAERVTEGKETRRVQPAQMILPRCRARWPQPPEEPADLVLETVQGKLKTSHPRTLPPPCLHGPHALYIILPARTGRQPGSSMQGSVCPMPRAALSAGYSS